MSLSIEGAEFMAKEVYLGSEGGLPLFKKRLILARREVYLSLGRVIDGRMPSFIYGA